MNKLPSISHCRGRGSLNHNNRVHSYKNVDESRTKDNIIYKQESLANAYEKCFGQAQRDYNQKQKRNDRKIHDYYTSLFGNANKNTVAKAENGKLSYYEIVVGVGDMTTCPIGSNNGNLATKILDEYARGFSKRNPNFYVFNSIQHLDEATPHLHINYIPVATGYKKGMHTQNGHARALEAMGFGNHKNSIDEWRKAERAIVRELCQKYGLEISEETQGRGRTYTPDLYKQAMAEAIVDVKKDVELIENLKDELIHEIRDGYIERNKKMLISEAQKQAGKEIENIKQVLAGTVRPIEGKIAREKTINAMADSMEEKTVGWGNNKKSVTLIKFEGTKEQVMTVFKAAQDCDNAIRAKNKAIADKDKMLKERDVAIADKEKTEKDMSAMMLNVSMKEVAVSAEIERAKDMQLKASELQLKAKEEITKAKNLYEQQSNLNSLYRQAVSERDDYEAKAGKAEKLEIELKGAYDSIGNMAQAVNSLLYDPSLKINNLQPDQQRALQAISLYARYWANKTGFGGVAERINKTYGISSGIQSHIDELMPKQKSLNKNHDFGL